MPQNNTEAVSAEQALEVLAVAEAEAMVAGVLDRAGCGEKGLLAKAIDQVDDAHKQSCALVLELSHQESHQDVIRLAKVNMLALDKALTYLKKLARAGV